MHARSAAVGLLSLALLGCGPQYPEFEGPPPSATGPAPPVDGGAAPAEPGLGYVPPALGPATAPSGEFAVKRFRVVRTIADRAKARSLEIRERDNSKGLVVARYAGPVRDYIDCGSYAAPDSGFSVPAVGSRLTRPATTGDGGQIAQDTHLSARLVALVERQGDEAANARVDGHYVIRRDLIVLGGAGRELRRSREFVDLTTDGQARFSDGVVCVATGALERSLMPPDDLGVGS